MKTALVLAILFLLLAAAIVFAVWAWLYFGEVEISMMGLLAMTGGILVALALGAGLMALMFYSARKGYDDDAGQD